MIYFKTSLLIFLIVSKEIRAESANHGESAPLKAAWHKDVQTGALQEKINKLKPGETLKLAPGIYEGPVWIRTPGVTIEGDGKAVIDGQGKGSVVVVEANDVNLQGLIIQGSGRAYDNADSGIALRASSRVRLLRNVLRDCLFGIDIYSGDNIEISENTITSRGLPLGLRGDALRIWSAKDVKVIKNNWSYSRDAVTWYSDGVLFEGNTGSHSRYSVHSMYSENLIIRGNHFHNNTVGIFLMYGSRALVVGNTIEKSQGPTGMGIGLKETSGTFVQANKFLYCASGLVIDNSPLDANTKNWFIENSLAFNTKAVVVNNDRLGNEFRNNVFSSNIEDATSENRRGSAGTWLGNVWDKYEGFDSDKDGLGDTPYTVMRYGDTITGSNPEAQFFFGSPALSLVEIIERFLPLTTPTLILKDATPRYVRKKGQI